MHKKRVKLPEDWFGTPTWPPFHCFWTPIWPLRRRVKTLYSSTEIAGNVGIMASTPRNVRRRVRRICDYMLKVRK